METATDPKKKELKKQLKSHCIYLLEQRITTARKAMEMAQESANSEEKSSAGDKHETARASSQLERDMNARQLDQAKKELELAKKIDVEKIHSSASIGSVIVTSEFWFFISIGLGGVTIDGKKILFLSPNAPVAGLLNQKKTGESFIFNGKITQIKEVF
ncbi:MAG: hypothetical protein H0V01_01290 [Bacteroidetes bacterium]|nr:hypothetical protein [Bacteroidota bacterium]HET6243174.1 hypothetical protein [Bacteroidia bacterium]